MLPGPCYIISDAHLGVADRESERSLVSFLTSARRDAGALVINGDLFEFWFEWRHVIPRTGFRTLAAVAAFADAGIPCLWIAGNHDCWGGEVLTVDAGVTYVEGPWRGAIAGWRTHVEHGDGRRTVEDRKYRALRRVLRNRGAIWLFRNLVHPDWASRLALGSAAASRNYAARDKGEGLRRVAAADLADGALDLVVYGHSHVPALVRTDGGIYGNPGTWLGDSTYLRITEEAIELRRWQADGAPALLATETRAVR